MDISALEFVNELFSNDTCTNRLDVTQPSESTKEGLISRTGESATSIGEARQILRDGLCRERECVAPCCCSQRALVSNDLLCALKRLTERTSSEPASLIFCHEPDYCSKAPRWRSTHRVVAATEESLSRGSRL